MPPTRKRAKDKKPMSCRICLIVISENYIVFEVDSEWTRLIEFCFGFPITAAACGPKIICDQCSKKIKDYCEFKTLALKSDALWNSRNSTLANDIQTDNTDVKEKIKIKYEVDEYFQDCNDEDCSESFQDVEYLNVDYSVEEPGKYLNVEYSIEEPGNKNKEQLNIDIVDIHTVKDEANATNKIERKPKKNKKLSNKKKSRSQSELQCDKEFIKKFFEILIQKKSNGKQKYECLKCGHELMQVKRLPSHVQKCYESDVLILKSQQQKGKEKTQYVTPSIYDCGLCGFQNVDDNVVMKHLNEQHCLTNDLHCKLCDYVGRDMADSIAHRFKHMEQDCKYRGKYRCPLCDKVRGNELCLEFHYRSVHLKKAGGWCHECNKTFTGYIYFRNHLRLHMEAKYICDTCGAKFLFRNLIVAHIKEHMNVRNYICDTCGKSFKRNNALSIHTRAYHTKSKPVICDHCNKQFKDAFLLDKHMKLVKKGNLFTCDVCGKGYPTKCRLKEHIFWHGAKRSFACTICGNKYKAKSGLTQHMRIHLGIYPYKCVVCGEEFHTSVALKRHSSVHTGIRKVKCLVCERTFHEKKLMLAHCKSKHKSFKC